jgi:hypothetical protein
MTTRCTYEPADLAGSPLALRCAKEDGHDGHHHLLSISADGSAAWLYIEDDHRPLEPAIHLDLVPGAVDDEMAVVLCAYADLLMQQPTEANPKEPAR